MKKKEKSVDAQLTPPYDVLVNLCKIALYADRMACSAKPPEQKEKDVIQSLFADRKLCEFVGKVLKAENIK